MSSLPPSSDSLSAEQALPATKNKSKKLLLVLLAPLALAGCQVPSFGGYKGVTKTANSTFHLWQGFNLAAIVVGGITLAVMAWAIFAYRAKKGDGSIPKQTQYHIPLEVTYTVIPILVVVGLFVATVVVENQVVADPTPSATINVTAFQWGWKFTYPGTKAVVVGQTTASPIMVMPVNQDVRINLVSSDVIHGFYIPEFNFSRFAQPGMVNTFTFHANKTGLYSAQCSQLCGLYHSLMYFRVDVVSPSQYQAWISSKNASTSARTAIAANGAIVIQENPGIPVIPSHSNGAQ